jgi:hypothetical protein
MAIVFSGILVLNYCCCYKRVSMKNWLSLLIYHELSNVWRLGVNKVSIGVGQIHSVGIDENFVAFKPKIVISGL